MNITDFKNFVEFNDANKIKINQTPLIFWLLKLKDFTFKQKALKFVIPLLKNWECHKYKDLTIFEFLYKNCNKKTIQMFNQLVYKNIRSKI